MKILAAPGPVSYPIIASKMKNKDIQIFFGKDGNENVDAILDSTVSLVRRNLKIDYITIKGLMVISPNIGKKIGVWRKGSAADVLTKALLREKNINAELIYANEMQELVNMLKNRSIDSAVLSSALANGKTFEELLNIPGSCGAKVYNGDDEFIRLYNEGIELIKEDPEGISEFIASNLPMQVPKNFIKMSMTNSLLEVTKLNDDSRFANLIKNFL
jgi:ABC-type amino acid transport substrate-binding protein